MLMTVKDCTRCHRRIENQEKYWLFKRYYCRECKEVIEIDRDHPYTYMKQLLDRFEQVEI